MFGFGKKKVILEKPVLGAELSENEEKLKLVMDLAKIVQWEYDVARDEFLFNDAFYDLYGTTAEIEGGYRLSSKYYAQKFVFPDDQEMVGIEIQKALSSEDPHYSTQIEHRIVRLDGEQRTITVRFVVVKDTSGKTIKTIGANQDITEIKKQVSENVDVEKKFAALFLNMKEGVVIHSVVQRNDGLITNYRIIDTNPAFTSHLGIEREAVVGKLATEAYGVDEPPYLEMYERVIKTQQTESFETYFEPMKKQFVISAVPLSGTHFATMFEDVTEERAKAREIIENEERLRVIYDNAPDAIYLYDLMGNFVDGNKAAEELTGYEKEELIGTSFLKQGVLAGGDLITAARDLASNVLGRGTGPTEYTVHRKDESITVVDVRNYPVTIGNKKLVLGIARDVSATIHAEVELRKFKQGIARSNDVVLMTDKNGLFTYVNFAFVDLYGYELDEIKTLTPRVLKSGKHTNEFYEHYWNTLAKGSVASAQMVNKTKDGTLVTVRSTSSPIIDENKQIVGYLAIQRDVTKEEAAEKALAERAEELERLNKVMVGRELKMMELKRENERLKQGNL